MGSATCRHSFPTCGKPSFPALNPDPLEQEKLLFANPEWNNNVFWSWHILKRFRLSISNLCQLTCDELSSECSEKCHVRGKCVVRCVAVAPSDNLFLQKSWIIWQPMKNSTCYFAHVWCCVAFPVTLAFWTRCGAHLNVKLERKRKNW